MSEMLGFEIEDAEEMEEQNEEDLVSLQDPWANIELKQHVIDELKQLNSENSAYIKSCVKHLEKDDKELWEIYITK
jgi:regulator of RNase E activity RraB